jgi:hypothetical protein
MEKGYFLDIWSISNVMIFNNWGSLGSTGAVTVFNLNNDQINYDFILVVKNKIQVIRFDTEIFDSETLIYVDPMKIFKENVEKKLQEKVELWWSQIEEISKFINQNKWEPRKKVEIKFYCAIALLYSLRAEYNPFKVVELISSDLGININSAKDRIKKARELGLLTSPGQGRAGAGEITQKAINLLKEEGLIHA